MADRFTSGDRVRTRGTDPAGHTRLPRYVRGAAGVVVGVAGHRPLADERARGRLVPAEPVYRVRFGAAQLFGAGTHDLVVELWESYLEPDGAGTS